jgi:hypothetical protein
MEKVFVDVSDIGDKIGPLRKKLNMSKSNEEKESPKKRSRLLRKIKKRQRKRP